MTDLSLEVADDDARALQYGGLDPALRPLVAEVGGLVARAVGAWPDGLLTSLTGLGVRPVSARGLDTALGLLARIGCPHPVVTVVEGCEATGLLTERGFAPATSLVRLVRDLADVGAPAESAFRVEEVGPSAAAAVVAVCRAGFGPAMDPAWWRAGLGRPGWTQVMAYDGDTPVATGALVVSKGVGWIGGTTTVPAARGRGAHRALLDLRLALAAQAGASRIGVLAADGGASMRNLVRAGFTVSHGVQQWRRASA